MFLDRGDSVGHTVVSTHPAGFWSVFSQWEHPRREESSEARAISVRVEEPVQSTCTFAACDILIAALSSSSSASSSSTMETQQSYLLSTNVVASSTKVYTLQPATKTTTTTANNPPSATPSSILSNTSTMTQFSLVMTSAPATATSMISSATQASPSEILSSANAASAPTFDHSGQATIIGAILGSIIATAVLIILAVCCLRRRHQRRVRSLDKEHDDSSAAPLYPPLPPVVEQPPSPTPAPLFSLPRTARTAATNLPRPRSTSSWPSRLSSAILTPVRSSVRPISSSMRPASSSLQIPSSYSRSAGTVGTRPSNSRGVLSARFFRPPNHEVSTGSPVKRGKTPRAGAFGSLLRSPDSRHNHVLSHMTTTSPPSMPYYATTARLPRPAMQMNVHARSSTELASGNTGLAVAYPPPTILAPSRQRNWQ